MSASDTIAAVDLGSNSFHYAIVRLTRDGFKSLESERIRVRLAAGLDERGNLTPEAQDKAIEALSYFGGKLAHLPEGCVRAVGTSTLRKAQNRLPFLMRARQALGHPIRVITGLEEARLIYGGVSHALPKRSPGRRLVIDIGGGSTECVVGEGFTPLRATSLDMGCVAWTKRFFPDGVIDAAAMDTAVNVALAVAWPLHMAWRSVGWELAIGSSGTMRAVESMLLEQGLTSAGLSAAGLARVRKELIAAGHIDRYKGKGLSDTRRPVIAGGVAVLTAVMEALDIAEMQTSQVALREGVLWEMIAEQQAPQPVGLGA